MIKQLVSLFFDDYIDKVKEKIDRYELIVDSSAINIPTKETLEEVLSLFPSRDNIIIDILLDDSDPYSLSIDNIEDCLKDLQHSIKIEDDLEKFRIRITIIKNCQKGLISIYSFSDFFSYLTQLELKHLLQDFNELFGIRDVLDFEFLDGTSDSFYTQSIFFNAKGVERTKLNREELINKRNEVSNLINFPTLSLVPNDFYLIGSSSNTMVNKFFDKLAGIMALIFISDITSINGLDELHFKINGYKLINSCLEFRNLDLGMDQIYDIYNWIFHEGTVSDKIGLSRNVISLNYMSDGEKSLLKPNTFNSIKSSYSIYLKQNVQQYIDVTNKMSEYLINLTMKVNDVINNFGNSFRNNNLVVVSFFLSVIVFNALSAGKFNNIFSGEILSIAILIIVVSIFYLVASIYITREEIHKFVIDYSQLKSIYKDLINSSDLKRIFNNEYLNTNIAYVNRKISAYSVVWGIEILSFIVLLLVTNIPKEDVIKIMLYLFSLFLEFLNQIVNIRFL